MFYDRRLAVCATNKTTQPEVAVLLKTPARSSIMRRHRNLDEVVGNAGKA